MRTLSVVLCTLVVFFAQSSVSLKCAPEACHTVRCNQDATNCPPGYSSERGGYCLCCQVCKKIIGLGENCSSGSPIGGVISDTVVCGKGLYCKNNDVCAKSE